VSRAGPRVTVGELTLSPAYELRPDATIRDVAEVLVRERVPAALLGAALAIVSEHDVVRAVARGRSVDERAAFVATPDPIGVARETPVLEAAEIMLRQGLRALVVVDGSGRAIGMLTLVHAVEALFAVDEVPAWLSGLRVALRVQMEQ